MTEIIDIELTNTTYRNKPNILTVDLGNKRYYDNNMNQAFYNCSNLISILNINQDVTNMCDTFSYCSNLVNAPTIGNSVQNMSQTFLGCSSLVNAPIVPNSVTFMYRTFTSCSNLVNLPVIGANVTSVRQMCEHCYSLTDSPVFLGNKVTNMISTFHNCRNLVNVNPLPESAQELTWCFMNCVNLVNAPNIPNSATNITSIFRSCINLVNPPHIPHSVTEISSIFDGCSSLVNAPEIPNSVTDMSYTFSNCSSLMNAPEIPNSVTDMSYTFSNCSSLMNAPEIPNSVTNMGYTFSNCYNLVNAPEIPNSVTDMSSTFRNCFNLVNTPTVSDSVTDMSDTYHNCINLINASNSISNTADNISHIFDQCYNLQSLPLIPKNVTNMYASFWGTNNCNEPLYIQSDKIINATACFGSSSISTVYVPYTYSNGVQTTTYNTMVSAGYESKLEDFVYLLNIATTPSDQELYVSINEESYTDNEQPYQIRCNNNAQIAVFTSDYDPYYQNISLDLEHITEHNILLEDNNLTHNLSISCPYENTTIEIIIDNIHHIVSYKENISIKLFDNTNVIINFTNPINGTNTYDLIMDEDKEIICDFGNSIDTNVIINNGQIIAYSFGDTYTDNSGTEYKYYVLHPRYYQTNTLGMGAVSSDISSSYLNSTLTGTTATNNILQNSSDCASSVLRSSVPSLLINGNTYLPSIPNSYELSQICSNMNDIDDFFYNYTDAETSINDIINNSETKTLTWSSTIKQGQSYWIWWKTGNKMDSYSLDGGSIWKNVIPIIEIPINELQNLDSYLNAELITQ